MFKPQFSKKVSFELASNAHDNETYQDCHCWVFTSSEFRELLEEA